MQPIVHAEVGHSSVPCVLKSVTRQQAGHEEMQQKARVHRAQTDSLDQPTQRSKA